MRARMSRRAARKAQDCTGSAQCDDLGPGRENARSGQRLRPTRFWTHRNDASGNIDGRGHPRDPGRLTFARGRAEGMSDRYSSRMDARRPSTLRIVWADPWEIARRQNPARFSPPADLAKLFILLDSIPRAARVVLVLR